MVVNSMSSLINGSSHSTDMINRLQEASSGFLEQNTMLFSSPGRYKLLALKMDKLLLVVNASLLIRCKNAQLSKMHVFTILF